MNAERREELIYAIAAEDLKRQEDAGKLFTNRIAILRHLVKVARERADHDQAWLQHHHDRLYGAVHRPAPFNDPNADIAGITFDVWLEQGAPGFEPGAQRAAQLRSMMTTLARKTSEMRDTIAEHPHPRSVGSLLGHEPAPGVAQAIHEDVVNAISAKAAGRDSSRAVRDGWNSRIERASKQPEPFEDLPF